MRRHDVAELTALVSVPDQLSFRAATSHLRVSPALSHAMRHRELLMDLLTLQAPLIREVPGRAARRLRPCSVPTISASRSRAARVRSRR